MVAPGVGSGADNLVDQFDMLVELVFQPLRVTMDALESLVASLLEREGFWVRSCVKVELTKEEKCIIGRPSSPRWELDLVAYKGGTNELRVVECKSYLDSRGVSFAGFDGSDERYASRFKLFNEGQLRQVVFQRLVAQMSDEGRIALNPHVTLCLVAGKIASDHDRDLLRRHFEKNEWLLWDDEWLRKRLKKIADGGYENDVTDVVAKIILRSHRG